MPACPTPHIFSDATTVLADSSGLVAFAEHGCTGHLINYLGRRLSVTTDVNGELFGLANSHPTVATLVLMLKANGPPNVVSRTTAELDEAMRLARVKQKRGDDAPKKHLGECSTVVVGKRLARTNQGLLLCLDDGYGRALASASGLTHARTNELICEMVCATHLSRSDAEKIWKLGLHRSDPVAQRAFKAALH